MFIGRLMHDPALRDSTYNSIREIREAIRNRNQPSGDSSSPGSGTGTGNSLMDDSIFSFLGSGNNSFLPPTLDSVSTDTLMSQFVYYNNFALVVLLLSVGSLCLCLTLAGLWSIFVLFNRTYLEEKLANSIFKKYTPFLTVPPYSLPIIPLS
jgi:hypothetical protein